MHNERCMSGSEMRLGKTGGPKPHGVPNLLLRYLPMAKGFCYLVAVMDWASRRVLAWRLSNTLDPSFCTEALEEALKNYETPEIFNTDQGEPVYLGGVYRGSERPGDSDQHGRQGSVDGQCFHRKTLEERQIRRSLS